MSVGHCLQDAVRGVVDTEFVRRYPANLSSLPTVIAAAANDYLWWSSLRLLQRLVYKYDECGHYTDLTEAFKEALLNHTTFEEALLSLLGVGPEWARHGVYQSAQAVWSVLRREEPVTSRCTPTFVPAVCWASLHSVQEPVRVQAVCWASLRHALAV